MKILKSISVVLISLLTVSNVFTTPDLAAIKNVDTSVLDANIMIGKFSEYVKQNMHINAGILTRESVTPADIALGNKGALQYIGYSKNYFLASLGIAVTAAMVPYITKLIQNGLLSRRAATHPNTLKQKNELTKIQQNIPNGTKLITENESGIGNNTVPEISDKPHFIGYLAAIALGIYSYSWGQEAWKNLSVAWQGFVRTTADSSIISDLWSALGK